MVINSSNFWIKIYRGFFNIDDRMLPTVSVIVPAKNEEKVIRDCVESLIDLDYPKNRLEIMVVVDDSKDRTLEICKEYEPAIKVIELAPKKCKAEALNEVIPLAKGEILSFFDADCVVDRHCLTEAVSNFSDARVDGVSGAMKTCNKENFLSRTLSLETCFTSFTEYFLNRLGANSHFCGKNMFIRKDVLEKIGGFDEASFLEDIEISFRMKRTRHKVVFEPKAVAWQNEPEDFRSYLNQRERWARGIFRVKKLKMQNSFRNWLSDVMHSIPYYFSPFSLITLTALLVAFWLNLHLTFTLPLLFLFLFTLSLIVYSRIFFKESLKDLALLPFWFLLTNLYTLFIVPKAYLEEKRNMEMKW